MRLNDILRAEHVIVPLQSDTFRDALRELIERLVALPGLNESTAHYIAMRALGEPDTFPYSDADHGGSAPLAAQRHRRGSLTERAEAWRPWRSYGALHLWRADGMKPKPAHQQHCAPAAGPPSTCVSPSARQR